MQQSVFEPDSPTPEAHLRLGRQYNAAGKWDKAALEYEEFLKKQPNHLDRKKFHECVSANEKIE